MGFSKSFRPKGNIMWKCATPSLVWSIWNEIVEFFMINMILLILFGLWFNTHDLSGVPIITPNSFVITALLWFSTIERPLLVSFSQRGSSRPLPLGCSLLPSWIYQFYPKNIYIDRTSKHNIKMDCNEETCSCTMLWRVRWTSLAMPLASPQT